MAGRKLLLFFFYMAIMVYIVMVSEVHGKRTEKKLFVFGDSYVDTGNLARYIDPKFQKIHPGHYPSTSWREPYGITFPGKPTGRFSDGRVFSDYIASFLGIRSPIPYKYRRYGHKLLPYGMNFALGGTGLFDTWNHEVNITVQIDRVEEQIREGVFTKSDLESSVALISVSGNDYFDYLRSHGANQSGLYDVVEQSKVQYKKDLKRLHDIGVRKVAAMGMHPMGCCPYIAGSATYPQCDRLMNDVATQHNIDLQMSIEDLNAETKDNVFLYINIYDAFMAIIDNKGGKKFEDPMMPCCAVISSDHYCGSVDEKGNKLYTLCDKPDASFYWDPVHPTQAGWVEVFAYLKPSLSSLLD